MEATNQGLERHFHCSNCNLTVHANDRENHISGARHRYKIREGKSETDPKATTQYQCDVCDRKFTDLHFFTIHQGSKTHRRNLRRTQTHKRAGQDLIKLDPAKKVKEFQRIPRRVPIQGIDSYLTINDFKDVCDYKSVREKYRPRNTKNPEGNNKTYVSSVTAYWAVSLTLESTVQDFKICLNDKEWGDFGDVVLEVTLKETNDRPSFTTTFAVQFKDISNNVNSIDSLAEGRFGFAKYVAQVNAIKLRKDVENKKYVIFTTALAEAHMERRLKIKNDILHKTEQQCDCRGEEKEVSVVAKPLSNRRKVLINTSDENDVFFFFCTDNMHVLPRIYLYTHQKKQKHFGNWIDELVSGCIGYGERKVDIHRELIKYIEYWGDGYLGGSYKLKKEDVLVKLGHLLLYSFKIPPVVGNTSKKQNYVIWQQAVNSVDITILSKHPRIIAKVCEPINVKIETELDLKIDTTTASINLDQSTIKQIQNPVLKMYLFEETMGDLQDDIPIDLVYDFFWKAGLVPLLLKAEDLKDQEHILDVVTLLKSLGLTRRYFLMTLDQNFKNSVRSRKTLSFFINVDDIAHKLSSCLLDYVKINVTEQFSLSLRTIQESDVFFQKTVSVREFFDMSLGRYGFKPFNNYLATNNGQDTQLVLKDDMMAKLKEEIESKNETKMVLLKNENESNKHYLLRDVQPDLFCR